MAASPKYKIFNSANEYIASTKHIEDAAILVSANGSGSTIRVGHSKSDTVWSEGLEKQPASESFDYVGLTVSNREFIRYGC